MKPLSLEPVFLPATTDIAPLRSRLKRNRNIGETLKMLREAEFDAAYDMLRAISAEAVAAGEAGRASSTLAGLDQVMTEAETEASESASTATSTGDEIHAAVLQILTALLIEEGNTEEAALTAARALNMLASDPKRKDAPFLQVLGSLLYDIAYLHSGRGEYKQAEREVEKAIKIFERLAKSQPDRYAPAHVMALNNATATYRNRVKQAEILAHYQAATSAYLQMLNAGVEDAAGRLVESLTAEGDTLAQMGRHREAIQYYSRALKYLTRIEPEFSLRTLRLSISLGESMLSVNAMRDKGVHLLNTMLHKATKINALNEHRRIVDSLYHAKSRSLDILSLWHKVFPR